MIGGKGVRINPRINPHTFSADHTIYVRIPDDGIQFRPGNSICISLIRNFVLTTVNRIFGAS